MRRRRLQAEAERVHREMSELMGGSARPRR
jgi:hypothetical protein